MKSALRLVVAVTVLLFARPAAATIEYHISLKNPEQHEFHVSMQVSASETDDEIIVALPAWNALYQVRDFAYRVRNVHANTPASPSSTALSVQKLDKQTWRISLPNTALRAAEINYAIEWDDPGPFNSQLDAHHAFVNFAEVLMYVPTRRGEQTAVQF